jgi:hypothetical protein
MEFAVAPRRLVSRPFIKFIEEICGCLVYANSGQVHG